MKITHLIRKDFLTINPFSGLNAVKNELLEHNAIVVQDENNFYGVLTIKDFVEKPKALVIDCLSIKKIIDHELSVEEVLTEMNELNLDVLPVGKNEEFIGLVFKNELFNYISEYNLELEAIINKRTIELKKALQTKDLMFSIIAHDLRSPFNTFIGFSDLLKKNLRNYEIEKAERFISEINSQAKKTFNLLENLLNWAKNQSGTIAFNPSYCNIGKISDDVIEQLRETAQMKNITLKSFHSTNVYANADKNMVEIILRNLISNAIIYTEKNGFVEVYSMAINGFIELTVSDTGIGVDDNDKLKIFTIDENKTKLGTANEKGSGLGLVICKDFVKRHQGKLWVEDKENKGSLFKFTLPIHLTEKSTLTKKDNLINKVKE